jgi:hypothetical protein
MASWWDWWWNNVGAGGIESGAKRGAKAGDKVGDMINKGNGLPDVTGAMSSLSDALSFSKAVWLNVSDYRMWRSLGWLILGILMMILGFVVWNRKAIGAAASKVPI